MKHKLATTFLLPVIMSLVGCGTIEPRIDVPAGTAVTPEYVTTVKHGALDTFRGFDLAFDIQTPTGGNLAGEVDEGDMDEQPSDTYRFAAGSQMPLGTRIEGVWTARFRPLLGFADRIVSKTRRAHVGHDVGLIGLGLVDANGNALPEFQSNSPFLEGCRTVASGEPFTMVALTSNRSFTPVPAASIRGRVLPSQATVQPQTLTETVALPAETISTGVQLGLFTATLPQGVPQVAVDLVVEVEADAQDFDPANDVIAPLQASPDCFDDAGTLDRDICQVCLIVQEG